MDQINIIICTPGRLLQHFDENPLFDCVNLQVGDLCLVLAYFFRKYLMCHLIPGFGFGWSRSHTWPWFPTGHEQYNSQPSFWKTNYAFLSDPNKVGHTLWSPFPCFTVKILHIHRWNIIEGFLKDIFDVDFRSVRDLARLSLKDPMYISVHEHAAHSTPESLAQSYLVCKLEDKVTVLFSFLKNHLKHKVIVFMSSCKEVREFTVS